MYLHPQPSWYKTHVSLLCLWSISEGYKVFIFVSSDISFLYDVPKKEQPPPRANPRDQSNLRAPEDEERKPVSIRGHIV